MATNEYAVTARQVDAAGSVANCKDAQIVLDTMLAGRADAFNPAELAAPERVEIRHHLQHGPGRLPHRGNDPPRRAALGGRRLESVIG